MKAPKKNFTPETAESILRDLRRPADYIRSVYQQTEEEKFSTLEMDFKIFHQQIKSLYDAWFPGPKPCGDLVVLNQILNPAAKSKREIKSWLKHSMACLLGSSERVHRNIKSAKELNDMERFRCELWLLMEMTNESVILLTEAFRILERLDLEPLHWKRFYLDPRETFEASKQILRHHVSDRAIGRHAFSPNSMFLLRQSIELWLQGIFGINYATVNGVDYPLQPERLFHLLDSENKKVNLPVPKSVIKSIHSWTQPFVHAGWMRYTWEIEHAQHVLSPIFYAENVSIERTHYQTAEAQLREFLNKPDLKLHRSKSIRFGIIRD